MNTIVYVDGFNLYYGCLKGSPYKWLDLHQLFANQLLNQTSCVVQIKYYTAPILGRMSDDPKSPQRQRSYLQALKKLYPESIGIIQGKMSSSTVTQRHMNPPPDTVKVMRFEEKQSDVNIAIDLICDGYDDRCEQVVLCSNDSDLEPAVERLRRIRPNIRIGLISPVHNQDGRTVSKGLSRLADWHKPIKVSHLQQSQLPEKIPGSSIRKPDEWY